MYRGTLRHPTLCASPFSTTLRLISPSPLSARKLAGRIAGLHLADNDGTDNRHLMPGDGNIDFEGLFQELIRQEYDGPLGVDLGSLPNLGKRYTECAAYLRTLAKKMNFKLEG